MRNKEQFKAYVYAKAEAAQAKGRKRRRLICHMFAAEHKRAVFLRSRHALARCAYFFHFRNLFDFYLHLFHLTQSIRKILNKVFAHK